MAAYKIINPMLPEHPHWGGVHQHSSVTEPDPWNEESSGLWKMTGWWLIFPDQSGSKSMQQIIDDLTDVTKFTARMISAKFYAVQNHVRPTVATGEATLDTGAAQSGWMYYGNPAPDPGTATASDWLENLPTFTWIANSTAFWCEIEVTYDTRTTYSYASPSRQVKYDVSTAWVGGADTNNNLTVEMWASSATDSLTDEASGFSWDSTATSAEIEAIKAAASNSAPQAGQYIQDPGESTSYLKIIKVTDGVYTPPASAIGLYNRYRAILIIDFETAYTANFTDLTTHLIYTLAE